MTHLGLLVRSGQGRKCSRLRPSLACIRYLRRRPTFDHSLSRARALKDDR